MRKFSAFGFAMLIGAAAVTCGTLTAVQADTPRLGDLRSFEVQEFNQVFDNQRVDLHAEFLPELMTALSNQNALPKASPAEGVIHMRCANNHMPECNRIITTVTVGDKGPVVWRNESKAYKFFSTWWFGNIPVPPEQLTVKVIQQLADDYQRDLPKNVSLPKNIP